MKRILALTLSAALLLTLLCACSGGADPKDTATPPDGSSQVDLTAFYLSLTEKYAVCETVEQAYPDDMVNDDSYFEPGTDMEQRQQWLEEQREFLRQAAQGNYPGLSDIATEQCLTYAPMFSLSAAESVLVQVSNAADVDAVKEILQARIDAQVAGGAFYPMAVEAWQNNSRIVSNGNYIMLVVSDDCDAVVSEFNALFK